MIKLVLGFMWLMLLAFIFSVIYLQDASSFGTFFSQPIVIIFFIPFILVGLSLIFFGLKDILKNNKIQKYGIECYGIIRNILQSGKYVNKNPEYKAEIDIVNPETNQVETVNKIIGFNYNEYPIDSYILCKYYQGDANIIRTVFTDEVPSSIKHILPQVVREGKN